MTTSLLDRFTVRPFALLIVGPFVSLTVGLSLYDCLAAQQSFSKLCLRSFSPFGTVFQGFARSFSDSGLKLTTIWKKKHQ